MKIQNIKVFFVFCSCPLTVLNSSILELYLDLFVHLDVCLYSGNVVFQRAGQKIASHFWSLIIPCCRCWPGFRIWISELSISFMG